MEVDPSYDQFGLLFTVPLVYGKTICRLIRVTNDAGYTYHFVFRQGEGGEGQIDRVKFIGFRNSNTRAILFTDRNDYIFNDTVVVNKLLSDGLQLVQPDDYVPIMVKYKITANPSNQKQVLKELGGKLRAVIKATENKKAGKRKANDGNTRRLRRRVAQDRNTTNLDNAQFITAMRSLMAPKKSDASEATFTMLEQVSRIGFGVELNQRNIGWDRIPQSNPIQEPKYSLGDLFKNNGISFIIVAGGFVRSRNVFYYDVRSNRRYKGPYVISESIIESILGKPKRSELPIHLLNQFDLSTELKQKITEHYKNRKPTNGEEDEEDDETESEEEEPASDIVFDNAVKIFWGFDYLKGYITSILPTRAAIAYARKYGQPLPPSPPELYMIGDEFVVKPVLRNPEYWLLIGGGELPAQGAAGSGEKFFDFINDRGETLRCKESEIPSLLGVPMPRKKVHFYHLEAKYNIGALGITKLIKNQRTIFGTYVKGRIKEFYEGNAGDVTGNYMTTNKTEMDLLTDWIPALDFRFNQGVKPREVFGSTLSTEKERSVQNNIAFRTPQGTSIFDQMIEDQLRRGEAYRLLHDKTNLTDTTAIDAEIKKEAKKIPTKKVRKKNKQGEYEYKEVPAPEDKPVCQYCLQDFKSELEEDPDEGKAAEYLGKPVQLRCGHWFHINCLKKCQTPAFTNYNYNNPSFPGGDRDRLKPTDSLRCIICRTIALDNTFGDGVYRLVNLRF